MTRRLKKNVSILIVANLDQQQPYDQHLHFINSVSDKKTINLICLITNYLLTLFVAASTYWGVTAVNSAAITSSVLCWFSD